MSVIKRILILAANPKNTSRLRLDEEVREIDEGMKRSKFRDRFEVHHVWAVQQKDLRRALLDYEPHIVHFCGHGQKDGIVLEDKDGNAILATTKSLSELFSLFQSSVECVLLNACYSESQAEIIIKQIRYVIGMQQAVSDKTAIEFATGFYDALGAGKSIEESFKFGCNAIDSQSTPEYLYPVLKKNRSRFVKVVSKTEKQVNIQEFEQKSLNENGGANLWAPQISEVIAQGLLLLEKEDVNNYRLAYLSIDDAIELGAKAFFSLPRRVTGFSLNRDLLIHVHEDFHLLLNTLEEYAPERLSGIDLEEVEWFHSFRNQLYSQGNILSIEKKKIEIYADLAKLFYKNLFNIDIVVNEKEITSRYLAAWQRYEQSALQLISYNYSLGHKRVDNMPFISHKELLELGFIDKKTSEHLGNLSIIRNRVVHGEKMQANLTEKEVDNVIEVVDRLENQLNDKINLEFSYSVDLVLCIDSSYSMRSFIDSVKKKAVQLHDDLYNSMVGKGKRLDLLRIKVIDFGTSDKGENNSVRESSFFTFPIEQQNFTRFVESITPREEQTSMLSNGLEVLTLAIKSNWSKIGSRKRHVIVIWTDVEASKPGKQQLNDLTDLWESSLDKSANRLILFAPAVFPWELISEHWTNTIHHPAKAGEGLSDVDYKTIITSISSSI